MTWLVWRQYRRQALLTAGPLAALVVLLIATGIPMASEYHSALTTCASRGTCGDLQLFTGGGYTALTTLVWMTLAVPGLLGLFWGGPLLAAELEQGTHQFIWTQGVTRRRWLITKIGWILLAAAVWGAILAAVVTWWWGPGNAIHQDRFSPFKFDIQGIVPIAYSVFAVALGIAAGVLFRRILPALGATLAGFAGLLFVLQNFIRAHYVPAITKPVPLSDLDSSGVSLPKSSWNLGGRIFDQSGQAIGHIVAGGWNINRPPIPACEDNPGSPRRMMRCLAAHGYRGTVTYQPGGRYWAFQGIESGIFLLLAVALVAFTVSPDHPPRRLTEAGGRIRAPGRAERRRERFGVVRALFVRPRCENPRHVARTGDADDDRSSSSTSSTAKRCSSASIRSCGTP